MVLTWKIMLAVFTFTAKCGWQKASLFVDSLSTSYVSYLVNVVKARVLLQNRAY